MKQYNYDKFAEHYDVLELKASNYYEKINDFLDKIFKKHKVKTVLDMTCGTGAQAIGLARRGYKVTASDISKGMLRIAKKKAKGLKIRFHQGDMRTSKLGRFDAVVVIFNAIAHLTKRDFEKTIKNVSGNLNKNGLFVFDIFNLGFMKHHFRNYEFLDVVIEHKGIKYVRINNNKLDLKKGIMKINQKVYIQKGMDKPKVHKEAWAMQIYSADGLKELLEKNGFGAKFYDGSGRKFVKNKSLSIFVVAKKK